MNMDQGLQRFILCQGEKFQEHLIHTQMIQFTIISMTYLFTNSQLNKA